MTNLFLLSSPFQLLCANEAIMRFKLESNHLIVIHNGTEGNRTQMKSVIDKFGHLYSKIYFLNDETSGLIEWIKKFNCLESLISLLDPKAFYIGDYGDGLGRHIASKYKKVEVILLDDGWATLNISNRISYNSSFNVIKDYVKFAVSFFRYRLKTRRDVVFFTIFDELLECKNIRHSFESLTTNIEVEVLENTVYFLGSPIVEDGVVDMEEYISLMARFVSRNKDQDIIYVCHRRETTEKTGRLSTIQNMTILYLDLPIELHILLNRIQPARITSFYSTALYTLSKLLSKCDLSYIKIEDDKIKSRNEQVASIYEILKLTLKKEVLSND
jgi:hypothetical protein